MGDAAGRLVYKGVVTKQNIWIKTGDEGSCEVKEKHMAYNTHNVWAIP